MCLCFCFSTLSLNSSAVEYNPFTDEEMIYNAAEGTYYSVYEPSEFEPFSFFRSVTPKNSGFKISDLPWLEMPTYVRDILSAIPEGLSNVSESEYTGQYKLPFVSLVVMPAPSGLGGILVDVIAGYNLCVGSYFQTSAQKTANTPYRVFLISLKLHNKIFENAVCYTATYHKASSSSPFQISGEWAAVEPIAVGDNVVRYYDYQYTLTNRDYYFYGSSGMYTARTLQNTPINKNDSDNFPQYVTVNNPSSGFASGTVTYLPDVWGGYLGSFSPPSDSSIEASTQKGIWESIKALPSQIANSIKGFFTSLGDRISGFFDNLAEKIKGFFLPEEGFFDTYVSDFQNYFKDRFGLLYELPDAVIGILQQFIDYSPAESDYSITFPEVVMPVLDNGEWYDKVIIEETDITFEFLEQGAFNTLYSLYRSVVWMIFIFALINLIIRKSERVFGGGG